LDESNPRGIGVKINSSKWTTVPTYFYFEPKTAGISATPLGSTTFSWHRQPWNWICDGDWGSCGRCCGAIATTNSIDAIPFEI
jgi:hypothetical protein